MRTFIAVTSWLLWSLLALLALALLYIRVVNVIPPRLVTPEETQQAMDLFWFSFALSTVLAAVIYVLLWLFWRRAGQAPGPGFWLLMVVLYANLDAIFTSGFTPYFSVGDRGAMAWFALAAGFVFLGLTFPPFLLKIRSSP